jgi:hypothetical protein
MPDRRAPPVGANQLALSPPSLSLSRCPVGQACRRRPLACSPASLSVSPTPPVSSSSTSCPRSPRHGRTHVRASSGHIHAPAPLLSPAPCSPISPLSFAPSARLSRPLSRSAHACRELRHRPSSTAACSVAVVASVPRQVPR